MCGIFGIVIPRKSSVSVGDVEHDIAQLFRGSESRGKESAGLAFRASDRTLVYKAPLKASEMLRSEGYKDFWKACLADIQRRGGVAPFAAIGHARLVTNGLQGINANNQPVIFEDVVGVHNGIICNDAEIWAKNPDLDRKTGVDTEALLALIRKSLGQSVSIQDSLRGAFAQIVGQASVAILLGNLGKLVLASNHGSLYAIVEPRTGIVIFASESLILQEFLRRSSLFAQARDATIEHFVPGMAWIVDLESAAIERFVMSQPAKGGAEKLAASARAFPVVDWRAAETERAKHLKRCRTCVLPESVPNIRLDETGQCFYCRTHQKAKYLGVDALRAAVAPFRRTDGKPDCLVAFSGGRDSSYGLHYAKVVLGLNPIAYTYDWGMVTDLARRNISRMCAKLGIEHILVSADIRRKRQNIQKNILAWMKKPDLGMIPLFMAGDKEYYVHANRLCKELDLKLLVFSANPYEKTNFKTGFCGVRENMQAGKEASIRIGNMSLLNKARLAWYYARQFLSNPAYLNSSLVDTFRAFLATYFTKHDYLYLFDYIPWVEEEINETLRREYDWETAKDTDTTWRIGDGTAALYNYIYHSVAGFSEIDTFRSNQVREGILDRASALTMVQQENQPRYDSIIEYSNLISVNASDLLSSIDSMKRTY